MQIKLMKFYRGEAWHNQGERNNTRQQAAVHNLRLLTALASPGGLFVSLWASPTQLIKTKMVERERRGRSSSNIRRKKNGEKEETPTQSRSPDNNAREKGIMDKSERGESHCYPLACVCVCVCPSIRSFPASN